MMKEIMQKLEDILIAAAFSEAAAFDQALELLVRPSCSPLITEACP